MTDKFFKEYQLLCICKKCGQDYRAMYKSWHAITRLCKKCRFILYKDQYKKYPEYYHNPEVKKRMYEAYKKYIKKSVKNFMRRREIALNSYHKNKDKRKEKRREYYQRTKKKPAL